LIRVEVVEAPEPVERERSRVPADRERQRVKWNRDSRVRHADQPCGPKRRQHFGREGSHLGTSGGLHELVDAGAN
jgi:hypothetical protein